MQGRCPRCRGSVPSKGTWFAWDPRVCPTCRAKVRNSIPGRLGGAGLCLTGWLVYLVGRLAFDSWIVALLGAGLVIIGSVLQLLMFSRMTLLAPGPFCPACQYDLTGNTTGLCPECGIPVPPSASSATPR